MTETLDLLLNRSSVREFKPDSVAEALLLQILSAARQAPSSSNLQAYSILVIRDAEKRRALSKIAGNQQHILVAPILLALCADQRRLADVTEKSGVDFAAHTLEMLLVSCIDATLVGMCASLAAESLGLGTVMIGGLRNDPEAVARVLDLPSQSFVVFGLCIGWPDRRPPPKPRLPADLTVGFESYPGADADGAADPWKEKVAEHMANPRRAGLADALRRLGFDF